jgi:hypothetical protein
MMGKEIRWKDLPRSFADAIIIARARSLNYLWIDSLCIIQDSPEDWAEQSAQMREIYRNCDICIGANSSDGTAGCFRNRQGLKIGQSNYGRFLVICYSRTMRIAVLSMHFRSTETRTIIRFSEEPGYYRSNSSPQGTSVLGKVVYPGLA